MSKSVKIWLITATVLVALGLMLFAGVMVTYEWDFTKLSTVTYVTNTYKANGEFDKISINVDTTEIEFLPTENEDCSIVCFEEEKARHSATVRNDTLIIDAADTRKWYDHINIAFGNPKMTVYLPQNEYVSLFIETDTGNITIPKDFSFDVLKIKGDTSDVDCFASVTDTIDVKVSTGNINIDAITVGGLNIVTTTGNIKASAVTVKNDINVETDTGNIVLKDVVTTSNLSVESSTGDVRFEDSDAAHIFIKTSTGDVTGTLLSEKVFITETSTGRIRVPKTTSGGKCEITTSTGDIKIDVTHGVSE